MKNLLKIGLISLVVSNSLFGVNLGADATDSGVNSTAIGDSSTASGTSSTAVGSNSLASGNFSTSIGVASDSTGLYSNAYGTQATASGEYANAIGSFSEASGFNSVAIGDSSTASGVQSIAIGNSSLASGFNSVAIGGATTASRDNTVAIGNRQLVDVADATLGTDAVNYNQLQSYSANTLQSSKDYTDLVFSGVSGGGISETLVDDKDAVVLQNLKTYSDVGDARTLSTAKNYADEGDAQTLKQANDYTDAKINSLEQSLTKEYRSATATAIALGVSPILSNGNKNALGIGFGNYDGENAVAINYVAELDKNTHLQLGSSLSSTNNGFKMGVSYGW